MFIAFNTKSSMMKSLLFAGLLLASFDIAAQGNHQPGQRTRPTREEPEADCGSDLEYDEKKDLILHAKSLAPYTGICRSYYEDNRLEREVHFVDGKEDGIATTYYKRNDEKKFDANPGKVMAITEHKMGVPNGTWKYYYETQVDEKDKLAWENTYKEGKKDGEWKYYFENGIEKKIENWKEDKKNGVFIEFFANGKKKTEINYKDDKMHGDYKMYFDDETPFIEKKYVEGKQDGEEISYHKNAQIASIKRYKMGVEEGTWRTYYDDGKEKSTLTYVNGKIVGEQKEFFKEGQLKRKIVYVDGKITLNEGFDEFGNKVDQEDITYFKNGKTATVKRQKMGNPDGAWKTYYENGKMKSLENYSQGRLEGEQKEFWETGKLKRRIVYQDGEIVLTEDYDKDGKKIGGESEDK